MAKTEWSTLIEASDEVVGTMAASIHLDYASTIMRNNCPKNGPA